MTEAIPIRTEKLSGALILAAAAYVALSSLIFPTRTADSVVSALGLSVGRVIPSLFAFSVSLRLLSPAMSSLFSKTRRLCAFFSVSPGGMSMIAAGLLSGFPQGAAVYSELRRSGGISEEEGASLMPFSNNAGAAFLIGGVGAKMTGSVAAGALLFACQSACALFLILCTKGERRNIVCAGDRPKRKPLSFSDVSRAVSESASSMLGVAAFITFFSVLGDAVCADAHLGAYFGAAVKSLFEISSGSAALISCGGAEYLGFCVGAAGLSVYMQCESAARGEATGGYFYGRTLMAALCGVSFSLCSTTAGISEKVSPQAVFLGTALFAAAVLQKAFSRARTKSSQKKKNIKKSVENLL